RALAMTTYHTLIGLTHLVSGFQIFLKVLRADAKDAPVDWSGKSNSALSKMEQQGIPLATYYRQFATHAALGAGLLVLLASLIAVGIAPVWVLSPTGLGVVLWSWIAGPAAMWLAGMPNKRIFGHYPLVAAASVAAGL